MELSPWSSPRDPELIFPTEDFEELLCDLNWSNIWRDFPLNSKKVYPVWMRPIRYIFQGLHLPLGKTSWHKFEKKYFDYWIDNICGLSINPYFKVIRNNFGHRHYVSWLTLIAEKLNIGNNWQDN